MGPSTSSILAGVDGLTQIYDLNPDHPPIAPFTAMDGTITIGASAVPEPSSLFLGLLAAIGLILLKPALGSIRGTPVRGRPRGPSLSGGLGVHRDVGSDPRHPERIEAQT